MLHIAAARPEQYHAALSLFFAELSEQERSERIADVLEAERRSELSLSGLLVAAQEGRIVGAGLSIVQPDGTAFLWPPVTQEATAADQIIDALYSEINRWVDASGALLGQALVEPERTREWAALERNGYRHLADLEFMVRLLEHPLPGEELPPFETVEFDSSGNADRFARVLERTYEGTLDCPEFTGTRSPAQALESHRLAGVFQPSMWQVYRLDGKEAGVMLLSEHPEERAWEVVYMGLVPEARGKGLGRAMLLNGLRAARRAGIERVFLAVDSRNCYATRVYAALGFQTSFLKAVHVRFVERQVGE